MNYDALTMREKSIFDEGFREGQSKQAILELQGRDRFMESFRERVTDAVDAKLSAARKVLEAS